MEKYNINMKGIALMISALYLVSLISAVGINGPYLEDSTVYVMPGQSQDLEFVIQNAGSSPQDSNANVQIVSGNEFFRITDEKTEYFIPAGAKQPINTKIEIPEGTPIETTKEAIIRFNINPATSSGGTITFGSSIDQTFKIIVGERPKPILAPEPKKPNYLVVLILLISVIVLVLFIVMYLSRKKKQKSAPSNRRKKQAKSR